MLWLPYTTTLYSAVCLFSSFVLILALFSRSCFTTSLTLLRAAHWSAVCSTRFRLSTYVLASSNAYIVSGDLRSAIKWIAPIVLGFASSFRRPLTSLSRPFLHASISLLYRLASVSLAHWHVIGASDIDPDNKADSIASAKGRLYLSIRSIR